jgi:hypothetical protein
LPNSYQTALTVLTETPPLDRGGRLIDTSSERSDPALNEVSEEWIGEAGLGVWVSILHEVLWVDKRS